MRAVCCVGPVKKGGPSLLEDRVRCRLREGNRQFIGRKGEHKPKTVDIERLCFLHSGN